MSFSERNNNRAYKLSLGQEYKQYMKTTGARDFANELKKRLGRSAIAYGATFLPLAASGLFMYFAGNQLVSIPISEFGQTGTQLAGEALGVLSLLPGYMASRRKVQEKRLQVRYGLD